MKKILLLISVMMISFSAFAQDGVKWNEGTLQEVLNKAKSNKKGPKQVFIDCYTSWCGPCKWMANTVFPQKEAGDYFNKNFVCAKFDMEKDEGVDMKTKYAISAFPTFLILDVEGNEVGRVVGGDELPVFIEAVEKAKDPNNSPKAILANYDATKDMKYAYQYLEEMKNLYNKEGMIEFFEKYYDGMSQRDKQSDKIWEYLSTSVSLSEPFVFNTITDNLSNFYSSKGKAEVNTILIRTCKNDLLGFVSGRIKVDDAVVDKACELITYLSENTNMDNFTVNAAQAYKAKDVDALVKTVTYNNIPYWFSCQDIRIIQTIVMRNDLIPQGEKARFIKNFRDALQTVINSTDKDWETLKDVEIPEAKNLGAVPAMLMM